MLECLQNAPLFDKCGNESPVNTAHWTDPGSWKMGCGLSRLLTFTNFRYIKQLKFRLMCCWYTPRLVSERRHFPNADGRVRSWVSASGAGLAFWGKLTFQRGLMEHMLTHSDTLISVSWFWKTSAREWKRQVWQDGGAKWYSAISWNDRQEAFSQMVKGCFFNAIYAFDCLWRPYL